MNLEVKNLTKPSDLIFLLGGRDLEMVEIGNSLKAKGLIFHDRNLHWGAKLSAYQDLFDESHIFVGIELIPDIPLPRHYIEIDHHNNKSHLPSSIEQLAELLGIDLSRYQELVAANDKGYIPALKLKDASLEEINEIRYLDRKAQGVNEEDERLAEESLNSFKTKIGDLIIINSATPRFSCITDRLFPYSKLLIWRKDYLVYYGKGSQTIADYLDDLINQQKAYHGGGENGFVGIAESAISEKVLHEKYIPEIIKIVTNG